MKKNIYLTQFNTATERNLLPLATGILTSYLKSKSIITKHYNLNISILRDSPEKIIEQYDNPFLLTYSNYFWNHHYTLHIAKLAKEKFPNTIIVFGGPSVPNRKEDVKDFFQKHPFVDILVSGEGEIILCDILESFINKTELQDIKGICINSDTGLIFQEQRKPIDNFLSFPSPFLDGTFDELLKKYSKDITGVVWESNRGCPYSCTFCYWGGTEKRVIDYDENRVYKELDWIVKNKINYIFGADANFGIRERDEDIARYIANLNIKTGYPKFFVINWNKNSTDKIFNIVDALNVSEVSFLLTVSVQSFHAPTLEAIKRKNIKTEHFHNILIEAKKRNFNTYTELILGLPLETYSTFKDGLRFVLVKNLNYHFNIYPCILIPGTEMSDKNYINKYKIKSKRCELFLDKTKTKDYGFKEYQDIIVGTSTMDVSDWQKSYVFGFFVKSLYGFRLVYFIFNYLRDVFNLDLIDLFEYIIHNRNNNKVINFYIKILYEISDSILHNGTESIKIKELPGQIRPDMAVLLKVILDKSSFYSNLQKILLDYLKLKNINMDIIDLEDLMKYQNLMIPSVNSEAKVNTVFSSKRIKEYFNMKSSKLTFIDLEYTKDLDEFMAKHTYIGLTFTVNSIIYDN